MNGWNQLAARRKLKRKLRKKVYFYTGRFFIFLSSSMVCVDARAGSLFGFMCIYSLRGFCVPVWDSSCRTRGGKKSSRKVISLALLFFFFFFICARRDEVFCAFSFSLPQCCTPPSNLSFLFSDAQLLSALLLSTSKLQSSSCNYLLNPFGTLLANFLRPCASSKRDAFSDVPCERFPLFARRRANKANKRRII